MADIGIAKAAVRAATTAQADQRGTPKTGPSKFDDIRSQLAEQLTQDMKVPAPKQLSAQQAANLETVLRDRLAQSVANRPADVFTSDLKTARAQLNKLTLAANRMPDTHSSVSIRDALSSIESEFQKSAKFINGSKSMDPQLLLKMQTQLYHMDQNIQLLSKMVEQVTSGVKTIFQTQVG